MNLERTGCSNSPLECLKRGNENLNTFDQEYNSVVIKRRRKGDIFVPMTLEGSPNLKYSTPKSSFSKRQPFLNISISESQVDPVLKILKDAGIGPHCAGNEEDSEEFFKTSTKNIINNDVQIKSYVDKAFEEFDDLYANYSAKKASTPKTTYSCIESTIVDTPQCLVNTSPVDSPSISPSEVRVARRRAVREGHNDFREILRKSRIDVGSYFSAVFSTGKSGGQKDNVWCSTPKNNKSSSPDVISTPKTADCNIRTPLPLSGIRKLALTPHINNESALCASPFTPVERRGSSSFNTPYNLTIISPEKQLPANVKTSLLADVVCYVDVRTEKENMTESVKQQLSSLGAKVEKNFTKKVTHVIFKEGRISTFLKAKKHKIPMVSVLWIEACKIALRVVDTSNFPPKQMEKYEQILPFETLKKRRLPKLRTTGRHRGIDGWVSSSKPKCTRNAVTDAKRIQPSDYNSNERYCIKKLEFGHDKNLQATNGLVVISDSEDKSDDNSFCSVKNSTQLLRRQSAPAKLLSKKKRKKLLDKKADNRKDNDGERVEGNELNVQSTANENVSNNDAIVDVVHSQNRRKLYNPRFSYLSQQLETPQDTETSGAGSSSSVYPPSDDSKKSRGVRTKVTARRMKIKKTTPNRKKKALASVLENEELDSFRSYSRRSSLSLFVGMKKTDCHTIDKPTIVFTRLPSKNLNNLGCIVKDLGIFTVESKVTNRTTHLVANEPRRTLNMIKAIARGCWILHIDWVFKSKDAGKWLNEEEFEMVDFSSAVLHCRLERQAFGPQFCLDLFSNCGGIYISHNTQPPWKELEELVKLCKGRIVTQARAAAVIIRGEKKPLNDSASSSNNAVVLSEKWILDCITQNVLLEKEKYICLST